MGQIAHCMVFAEWRRIVARMCAELGGLELLCLLSRFLSIASCYATDVVVYGGVGWVEVGWG